MEKFVVNVLIPMAGEGSRFKNVGFRNPKPFIDVAGKPMIEWVLGNISGKKVKLRFIVVLRTGHDSERLQSLRPNIKIVCVDGLTEGAACTTLLAKGYIDNDNPLLIVNSDQFIEWDPDAFWDQIMAEQNDGSIVCFMPKELEDTKWSYARVNEEGHVTEVREKQVISNNATVGMYYWTRGSAYVKCAEQMIQKNVRVGGEFYAAPVYNEGIAKGMKFSVSMCARMHGLGTPTDLTNFLYTFVRPMRMQSLHLETETGSNPSIRFIAHRGNTQGPNLTRENEPSYVSEALGQGFDAEVDAWYQNETWYLGHDGPQFKIDRSFLQHPRLWVHCKNGEALAMLSADPKITCFFHQTDDFTLTSKGHLWTYPDKPLHGENAIAVMFSRPQDLITTPTPIFGICADNVAELRSSSASRESRVASSASRESRVAGPETHDPQRIEKEYPLNGKTKALIFDLDGVLVESKDIHYEALNAAIQTVAGPEFLITKEEHETCYDGLSTHQKLEKMTKYKNFPRHLHQELFIRKQEITQEMFRTHIRPDPSIQAAFHAIRQLGFQIGVASNCIRSSVVALLEGIGVMPYVDAFWSNEDVLRAKPFPDIYKKASEAFGCHPSEVLVFEDSPKGFEAAIRARANLVRVGSPADINLSFLMQHVRETEQNETEINIVFPLAKPTQQYWTDGPDHLSVELPLYLADLNGKPILEWICQSLAESQLRLRFIFLVRQCHIEAYHLNSLLPKITGYAPTEIVPVLADQLGAMKTVLLAKNFINSKTPLLVHDGGHYVRWENDGGISGLLQTLTDASLRSGASAVLVTTHEDCDPRWSYVQTLGANRDLASPMLGDREVIMVREKSTISTHACTGMYFWHHGADFVRVGRRAIEKNALFRGQFYLAPMLNIAIEMGLRVVHQPVNRNWSIRNLAELATFHRNITPHIVRRQLTSIYAEMMERNGRRLVQEGIRGDPMLLDAEDARRCHAVFALFTKKNWEPAPAFQSLMAELREIPGTHCIGSVLAAEIPYISVDLGLHFTLFQLIKFGAFSSTAIPKDYYEVLQGLIANAIPCFEIDFYAVTVTPNSVVLLGCPSIDLNSARMHVRRELTRIGYPLTEPYKANTFHTSLVRFASPVSSESLMAIIERYKDKPLGRLRVEEFTISPASWKMQPSELALHRDVAVTVSLSFS